MACTWLSYLQHGQGVLKSGTRRFEKLDKACPVEPPGHEDPLERIARACAGGFVDACGYAADLLLRSSSAKDHARARDLADRGCILADTTSCLIAANFRTSAEPGPLDLAKAKELSDRACKLGFKPACSQENPRPNP